MERQKFKGKKTKKERTPIIKRKMGHKSQKMLIMEMSNSESYDEVEE